MQPLIWRVEHFGEIDSTNTWLAGQARDGAPEGLVAYADFQRAGRGRLDREWVSPPGASLLCSILLRPSLEPDDLQLVVAGVALSARAALVRLSGVRPTLKWPNDLIVDDAKLAGLLAEVVTTKDGLGVVVGIGVNLTHTGPPEVRATSVLEQSGLTIAPRALLDILLEELEARRALLDTDEGRSALRAEYEGALATLGRDVRIETGDGEVLGRATSVDASGRLVVEVGGSLRVFSVGDVLHVRHESRRS